MLRKETHLICSHLLCWQGCLERCHPRNYQQHCAYEICLYAIALCSTQLTVCFLSSPGLRSHETTPQRPKAELSLSLVHDYHLAKDLPGVLTLTAPSLSVLPMRTMPTGLPLVPH